VDDFVTHNSYWLTSAATETTLTGRITAPAHPPSRRPAPDASRPTRPRAVVIHGADRLGSADRLALTSVDVLADMCDVEVWLPATERATPGPFSEALLARGRYVRYVSLPLAGTRGASASVRAVYRTWRALGRAHADLVYLTSAVSAPVAPLARLATRARVILQIEEARGGRSTLSLRVFAAACTRVLATSQSVLAATRLRRSRRVSVVCAATPETAPREDPPGTGRRSPRYVVASRWVHGTGFPTLLGAWDLAGCPGQLVILRDPPPPQGRSAQKNSPRLDVPMLVQSLVSNPSTVTIIDGDTDAAARLSCADAVIVLADAPGEVGLALVEACGRSLPAIAASTRGTHGVAGGSSEEIVHHGVTGWLFGPDDATGLADLLRRLTLADLAHAGRRARDVWELKYTAPLQRRRLETAIAAELSRSRSAISVVSRA
jgi:glycosyltransferase involved in cell wall biosynthesis